MKKIVEKFAQTPQSPPRKKVILTFAWGTLLHWGIIPPVLIIIFRRIDRYLPSLSIRPPYNFFLAAGLLILGLIWTIASILDQWRKGKGTFITSSCPTQKLVIEGCYRYSRNPMWIGYLLLFAGVGVFFNSVSIIFGLLPLATLFLVLYTRIFEEKVLSCKFGKKYEEYKSKTPFLFPVPLKSLGWEVPQRIKFFLSIILALAVFSSIFIFYNAFSLNSQLFGKILWHGPRDEKEIALTFDDGPGPYTGRILDVLEKYKVKATFFLVGIHVDQYPGLVRREVKEGNAIGNHTYSHSTLIFDNGKRIKEEIVRDEASIAKATGLKPKIIRLPRNWRKPEIFEIAEDMGYLIITESTRAWDWESPGVNKIVKNVMKDLKPGDIIGMHDGDSNHLIYQHSREQTVQALPIIIKEIRKRGYSFVTVPEMLSQEKK